MATFDYRCDKCGVEREVGHSIKESPAVECSVCSSHMSRLIRPFTSLIRGTTTSKLWQEERWRNKKSAGLEVKQLERYGTGSQLRPNIAGTEFESWEDARKAAAEARMDGGSFDGYVAAEKRSRNIDGVDEARWKRAKAKAA